MDYERDGYLLVRDAVPQEKIDRLESQIVGLVREWTGQDYGTTRTPEFANALLADRELERRLYDGVRKFDWLTELSLQPELAEPVQRILGEQIGLMGKIPLRFDLPCVLRELAVWHQDYWYVKGNTDVVTLWMPLQDTSYAEGCLMVMPGSHELGPIVHDGEALGKRHFPKSVFDREVRYVEMRRGDLLLFNSLLLHSSGVNVSDRVRLSVQARYSRLNQPTDPGMGELTPVAAGVLTPVAEGACR